MEAIWRSLFPVNPRDRRRVFLTGHEKGCSLWPGDNNPQTATVNPRTDTIYVTNFVTGKVTVINGRTNMVSSTISGLPGPDRMALVQRTRTLYVAGDLNDSLSVVSARTGMVTATIPLGTGDNGVAGIAVNPGAPTVYVTQDYANTVMAINGQTNTVIKATIKVGHSPFGIAVNGLTRTGYVINEDDSTVSVIALCRNSHTSFPRTLLSAVRLSRSAS
jgi:YVTN family beta-propeller protein